MQDLLINSKRVRRIMRQMDLQAKTKRKKQRTTDSAHDFLRYTNLVQEMTTIRPGQVWVADITYTCLRHEFVYPVVIKDMFTRSIRGWHLSRSLDQQLTLIALNKALAKGKPELHYSDQGVQYAETTYVKVLEEIEIAISMAEIGKAWQKGYA